MQSLRPIKSEVKLRQNPQADFKARLSHIGLAYLYIEGAESSHPQTRQVSMKCSTNPADSLRNIDGCSWESSAHTATAYKSKKTGAMRPINAAAVRSISSLSNECCQMRGWQVVPPAVVPGKYSVQCISVVLKRPPSPIASGCVSAYRANWARTSKVGCPPFCIDTAF